MISNLIINNRDFILNEAFCKNYKINLGKYTFKLYKNEENYILWRYNNSKPTKELYDLNTGVKLDMPKDIKYAFNSVYYNILILDYLKKYGYEINMRQYETLNNEDPDRKLF